MRSLFKFILLANAMVVFLNVQSAMSADTAVPMIVTIPHASRVLKNAAFKDENQQSAYALGSSLGRYMENSLKEQEKLGITLDKQQLIAGVQDTFGGKSKLSDGEIKQILQAFEVRVKGMALDKMEKDAKENAQKGEVYASKFTRQKGVRKTESGLFYKVEKEGTGNIPKDSDTVVVHYKGTLIDGREFDNSYTRREPLSFRLDGVIPGWTEGLKHVKKGGKIKLVIPPHLAYGKIGVLGIPVNSMLVFDIELLDINPLSKPHEKK